MRMAQKKTTLTLNTIIPTLKQNSANNQNIILDKSNKPTNAGEIAVMKLAPRCALDDLYTQCRPFWWKGEDIASQTPENGRPHNEGFEGQVRV